MKTQSLVAILRGISPDEAVDVAGVLIEAGFRDIEVPLNSPLPFDSIAAMVSAYENKARFGAGTVLLPDDVERVKEVGGKFIVSPHCEVEVIRATKAAGLISIPGVFTASEAFLALHAGADILKLFPATRLGVDGALALRKVLPPQARLYAVGGIGANNMSAWIKGGIKSFGIGGGLYKAGITMNELARQASEIVRAYKKMSSAVVH